MVCPDGLMGIMQEGMGWCGNIQNNISGYTRDEKTKFESLLKDVTILSLKSILNNMANFRTGTVSSCKRVDWKRPNGN